MAAALLGLACGPLQAAGPSARELDAAIKSGDFAGYLARATAWLDDKTPAKPKKNALDSLLEDKAFRTVLNQRHLIAKTGADELGAFAREDVANREFLGWLMKDTVAMDLYLEASVPVALAYREQDTYALKTNSLRACVFGPQAADRRRVVGHVWRRVACGEDGGGARAAVDHGCQGARACRRVLAGGTPALAGLRAGQP